MSRARNADPRPDRRRRPSPCRSSRQLAPAWRKTSWSRSWRRRSCRSAPATKRRKQSALCGKLSTWRPLYLVKLTLFGQGDRDDRPLREPRHLPVALLPAGRTCGCREVEEFFRHGPAASADEVQVLIAAAESDDIAAQRFGRFALEQEAGNEPSYVWHRVFLHAKPRHFLAADADAVQIAVDRRQGQADAAEQDVHLG